jgi:hypothetical protein
MVRMEAVVWIPGFSEPRACISISWRASVVRGRRSSLSRIERHTAQGVEEMNETDSTIGGAIRRSVCRCPISPCRKHLWPASAAGNHAPIDKSGCHTTFGEEISQRFARSCDPVARALPLRRDPPVGAESVGSSDTDDHAAYRANRKMSQAHMTGTILIAWGILMAVFRRPLGILFSTTGKRLWEEDWLKAPSQFTEGVFDGEKAPRRIMFLGLVFVMVGAIFWSME